MFDIFNMLKKNEENKTMQVTRETIIGDILDMDQTTAPYLTIAALNIGQAGRWPIISGVPVCLLRK